MEILIPKNVATLRTGDVLVVPRGVSELNHVTILEVMAWPYFRLSVPFSGPCSTEDPFGPYRWQNDHRGAGFISSAESSHPLIMPRTSIKRGIGRDAARWWKELPALQGELLSTEEILRLPSRSEFSAKSLALLALAQSRKGDEHLIRLRQAVETALQVEDERERVMAIMVLLVNYGLRH